MGNDPRVLPAIHALLEPAHAAPLDRLRALKSGWDSYGGKSIDERALKTAEAILNTPGQVVPCSNGGVQVEWHCGGVDVEICIGPDGAVEADAPQIVSPAFDQTLITRLLVPNAPDLPDTAYVIRSLVDIENDPHACPMPIRVMWNLKAALDESIRLRDEHKDKGHSFGVVSCVADAHPDTERLDWLQSAADSGVVNFTFELDGGNILDYNLMGGDGEDIVFRGQNNVRAAIDAARADEKKEG